MNAIDKLRELKSKFEKDYEAVFEFSQRQIKLCTQDPDTYQSDPLTRLCAIWGYENKPIHQCYWNDRFAIAVMCNLSFGEKQAAAWALICNSGIGYFEWFTHYGYDMLDVFRYIGIDMPEWCESMRYHVSYTSLPDSIIRKLVAVFDLPSESYRNGKPLNKNELDLKNKLNNLHPKLRMN